MKLLITETWFWLRKEGHHSYHHMQVMIRIWSLWRWRGMQASGPSLCDLGKKTIYFQLKSSFRVVKHERRLIVRCPLSIITFWCCLRLTLSSSTARSDNVWSRRFGTSLIMDLKKRNIVNEGSCWWMDSEVSSMIELTWSCWQHFAIGAI